MDQALQLKSNDTGNEGVVVPCNKDEDDQSLSSSLPKDGRVEFVNCEVIDVENKRIEFNVLEVDLGNSRGCSLSSSTQIKDINEELALLKELFQRQTDQIPMLEAENKMLSEEVSMLKSSLEDADAHLTAFKERKNVQNVFSMEVADYEKTADNLRKELKRMKANLEAMRAENDEAKMTTIALQESKANLTSNIAKMKSALLKFKVDRNEKMEKLKKVEEEKVELEKRITVVMAASDMEKMKLNAIISLNAERNQSLESEISSLNQQLVSLRCQRESLQRMLDDANREHSAFKTRALYILEQKKPESDDKINYEVERLEEVIQQQKRTIENMTNSHRLLHDELFSVTQEKRGLTSELSSLQQKLTANRNSLNNMLAEQRTEFDLVLASEACVKSKLLAQIDANVIAHAKEKERLVADAKRGLEKKLKELQSALEEVGEQKCDENNRSNASPNFFTTSCDIQAKKISQILEADYSRSIQLPQPLFQTNHLNEVDSNTDDKTLQQILQDNSVNMEEKKEYFQPNYEDLCCKLQKQVQHMQELLNESEATNIRVHEQTKLLKEEIRRMQRNEDRVNQISNNEYLKNVILKFITPEKVNSERDQLIPVLATMLKLNNEEIELLRSFAEDHASTMPIEKKTLWRGYFSYLSG